MSSSISPPYPKNLQILHDINYIDPISPLFSKKLDILQKKTFRANDILEKHNSYLETLKDNLYNDKNTREISYNQKKTIADAVQKTDSQAKSSAIVTMFKNTIHRSGTCFNAFLNFFQKIFDNTLGLVNGNIGATILGVVCFIAFFILVLWIFGVIHFEPKKSSTSTISSYNIPDSSELLPTPSESSELSPDISFSFEEFLKKDNKLEYTTNCINESFNKELKNSPMFQTIQKNYDIMKDGVTNTFKSFDFYQDNNIIQESNKSVYVAPSSEFHFHDELYLPIDGSKQKALFKPKNFTITSQINPDNEDYKFLISKITNYSLNDFSKIKIIFEEYINNNIDQYGCLKIKEIVSDNNDKIIFYNSSNQQSDNVIHVNYISGGKIEILFNQNKFINNIENIIEPLIG